jgi:Domain of unknown function (DUF4304)
LAKRLDAMLAEHVAPVLRPLGFRKTGRTYRLAAPNGTQGLINFQSFSTSFTRASFFVNVDVVVEAHRGWMAFALNVDLTKQPAIGQGFWRDGIWPPEDVEDRFGEYRSHLWYFDDDEGAARCGRHLTRIFNEETALPDANAGSSRTTGRPA